MSSSDEDGVTLMAAFKRNGNRNAPPTRTSDQSQLSRTISPAANTQEDGEEIIRVAQSISRKAVCVRIPPAQNKHEYVFFEPQDEVESVIRMYSRGGEMIHDVRLVGGASKEVSESGKGSLAPSAKAVKAKQLYLRREP